MATQRIDNDTLYTGSEGARFLILGDPPRSQSHKELLARKIKGEYTGPVAGVWGTLGKHQEDASMTWSGSISHSSYGNDDSVGVVLDEVMNLYTINPAIRVENTRVIERYINFDAVTFGEFPNEFKAEDIPRVRLTLFLQEDEGAVVFYQHFTGNWTRTANSDLEYILPKSTDDGFTTKRDRLHYDFPILPPREIEQGKDEYLRLGKPLKASFVVKALVFRRAPSDDTARAIAERTYRQTELEDRYSLLRYCPDANDFLPAEGRNRARSNKKTLLLLHGTFSSTQGSYGGLLKSDYARGSWLKNMSRGRYEQILGFDHWTIRHGLDDNLKRFRLAAEGLDFSNAPLDLMGFSRGGLLTAKFITDPGMQQFPVRKAAFVASANGVGYFHNGRRYLGTLLRLMRTSFPSPTNLLLTGFAQLSTEYFFSLPGPTIMNEDSRALKDLLASPPKEWNERVEIKAFTGRWTRDVHSHLSLLRRMAMRGTYLLTIPFIGRPNDLVVNEGNQSNLIPANARSSPDQRYSVFHTRYFDSRRTAAPIRKDLGTFFEPAVTPRPRGSASPAGSRRAGSRSRGRRV